MKRQENALRSSSLRRDNNDPSVNHAVDSTGCMAGVFQLISSKYLTRRKFLTFGKKQTVSFSFSSPQQSKPKSPSRKGGRAKNRDRLIDNTNSKNGGNETSLDFPRLSCQVPRSPTIPQEIRRSNSQNSAPDNSGSSAPSVVARLMGLDYAPPPQATTRETAAEKRRKLLGALEKCDGDLQALRRIIESVRCDDRTEIVETTKCMEQEQPSPVSVLEDFTKSPPPPSSSSTGDWCSAKRTENDICHGVRQATPQQQQGKKPGKDKTEIAIFCFHGNSHAYVPRSLFHPRSHRKHALYPPPSSAMVEAVNDACTDVDMGQIREITKVAVVIEDFVYRELIQEFIKELMGCCRVYSSLPFEKSKRKLRF